MEWKDAEGPTALKNCCDVLTQEIRAIKPPNRLWHYTNTSGFRGIIETGLFHFGNMRFLNDAREFLHSIDIMRSAIRRYRRLHPEPEARFLLDLFVEDLSIADENFVPWNFVCCFSGAENDLSQWRGYGGTLGVSLGFDAADLNQYSPQAVLLPCIYETGRQLELLARGIGNMIMVYLKHGPKMNEGNQAHRETEARSLIVTFLSYTGALTATFKHDGFRAENEWRLVAFNPPDASVMYHSKRESLSPYLPLKSSFERLPIREIFIGPGKHNHATALAAMRMMTKEGYGEIVPKVSDISYRPMV